MPGLWNVCFAASMAGAVGKSFVGAEPQRTVIVLKDDDQMVKRAARNIPWLHFLTYNRLRAHDLFYGRKVLLLESAAKALAEFYADK